MSYNKFFVSAVFAALSFGATSCNRNPPDERSTLDKKIGVGSANGLDFSSDGILHILESSDTEVTFRATSREFELEFKNLSSEAKSIDIVIKNIKDDLTLVSEVSIFSGSQTSEIGSKVDGKLLTQKWSLSIPAGTDSFKVEAKPAAAAPFVFLAMGDIQDGIDDFEPVIDKLNEFADADFMIFMGDVTMNSAPDEFELVHESIAKIKLPIFSTPGNHDIQNSNSIYQEEFGRANYSLTHKGARFSSVDSASWALSKDVWDWYEGWLEKGKDQVHIIFSHIAATETSGIRGGHWRSRREANYFMAQASRQKVDAMFFGHLHTLDIYRVAGIPTYISGGAGAFEERLDGIERHFLRVTVDPVNEFVGVEVILIGR